jgi:nickel transport protein
MMILHGSSADAHDVFWSAGAVADTLLEGHLSGHAHGGAANEPLAAARVAWLVTLDGSPVEGAAVACGDDTRGASGRDGQVNVRLRAAGLPVVRASLRRPDAALPSCEDVRTAEPVMRAASLLACLVVLAAPATAPAHGLNHTFAGDRAIVVTLTTDDGAPFSFESCEVTPPGEHTPSQVGRTDRRGRVAFLPDRAGDWRVRVMAEDGHGADLTVPVGADLLPLGGRTDGPSRFARIVTGVSVLFGIFGVTALFFTRRKP